MKQLVFLVALALALPAQARPILPKKAPLPARPGCTAQAGLKSPRPVQRGEVAERSEAGEGLAGSRSKVQGLPGGGPGNKPSAKPQPKAAARPVARPVPKPAPKPLAKLAIKQVPRPVAKPVAKLVIKPAATVAKPAAKPSEPASPPLANEVSRPSVNDPERERIAKLQEALDAVVRGKALGRLRVGMRVENLASGRVLFGWRSSALMDPASNQKVLATTAALLRLGSSFRYRTEVTGAPADRHGVITGDIVIRGSGDPSLRPRHLESLAESMARAGVTRVTGGVLGDPRRIGSDENVPSARAPLRVGGTTIEVRVRPGDRAGSRPLVSIRPASDAFVIVNLAETRAKGKAKLGVDITRAGGRFQVNVSGKISIARGEVVVHRAPPSHSLYAAMLLRHTLSQAGIVVQGPAGVFSAEDRLRVASGATMEGALLAVGQQGSDVTPPLAARAPVASADLLALHESEPLPMILRRVNKRSDNEWAERVLETVGAEVLGGAPTTAKGLRVLREALAELGIAASAYVPSNGSGLGHRNRVTAAGMTELFHRLYFDPRIGPELLQSLSVGGVDGTTRNRFRGTSAAHRVRAKTGTLSGVSCLSGLVGDGADVLAFSILVEGHRKRAVPSVRAAQVSAVNAMMRYVRNAAAAPAVDDSASGTDYETGDEVDEDEKAPGEGP